MDPLLDLHAILGIDRPNAAEVVSVVVDLREPLHRDIVGCGGPAGDGRIRAGCEFVKAPSLFQKAIDEDDRMVLSGLVHQFCLFEWSGVRRLLWPARLGRRMLT